MATELGLLSLNHLQKLAQSQQHQTHHHHHHHHHHQVNPNSTAGSWMWNPIKAQEVPHEPDDYESWEVKAFAEETSNAMGTTWPPRSYTCTFCRREFRSAQALGGHMNVHRRDRARLHQTQPPPHGGDATTGPLINHTLLYQFPSPNGLFFTSSPTNNACSIDSPYHPSVPPKNFPATPPGLNSSSSLCSSSQDLKETSMEDLDLELRLGHRPKTTIKEQNQRA
ncbi:hypothetical protein E1A91_D03G192500v1 [Gossypium mustelinum]|uniref:C2H2-type domain-containing protein n=1 Tax=Gossypium mustelinum TaxID=34275 RepID=A0A5D2VQ05_GOSMU|nr:hypothetical protein E1A91_D03G192500v1 [Gossypium mustelinum]